MKKRTTVTIISAAVAVSAVCAQATDSLTIAGHLNAAGVITVTQPAGLDARLTKEIAPAPEEIADGVAQETVGAVHHGRAGFRVQIFDDNNVRTARSEAQARKNQIELRFPEYKAYVTFNSPYWRVKVGDFTSRSEAEAAMAEIRQAFPSMARSLRIVRDRIN